MENTNRKVVLVTGCSTGIGRACALRLDELGWRVYAGVRRTEDAESLKAAASERLRPVMLDVTRADQIKEVAELVAKEHDGLHGLVNNAGINVAGPLEFLSPDDLRRQFEVNVFGLFSLTQALLPPLRKAGGRVVNIGSVSGWIAMPLVGPYCASKFALRALSDSLRLELRPWGVRVILVDPGPTSTLIYDKARRRDEPRDGTDRKAEELYGPMIERALAFTAHSASRAIPPERAAGRVIRALERRRPKAHYFVGASLLSGLFLLKLPVRLRDWLVARYLLKNYE